MNEKHTMARETRRQGRQGENEETRSAILRVSQELFMEYGYRAVSTRQIADVCGLTQPALYHHFTDKQQLYAAMATEELTKIGAALERIACRDESVEERLAQAARYLLSTTHQDLSQMMRDIRHELDEETRASLTRAFQAGIVQPLSTIFSDGLRAGLLKTPEQGGLDPQIGLYLFMSMISQFMYNRRGEELAVVQGHEVSIADAATMIVQTLLYGLAR
jgi:AcrR family transcriptional regulator